MCPALPTQSVARCIACCGKPPPVPILLPKSGPVPAGQRAVRGAGGGGGVARCRAGRLRLQGCADARPAAPGGLAGPQGAGGGGRAARGRPGGCRRGAGAGGRALRAGRPAGGAGVGAGGAGREGPSRHRARGGGTGGVLATGSGAGLNVVLPAPGWLHDGTTTCTLLSVPLPPASLAQMDLRQSQAAVLAVEAQLQGGALGAGSPAGLLGRSREQPSLA